MNKTIEQTVQNQKQQNSSNNASLIGLSGFPPAVGTGQDNFIVYSTIQSLDNGYGPDGKKIAGSSIYVLPPPLQILDMDSADWLATEFYVLKEALEKGFLAARGAADETEITMALAGALTELVGQAAAGTWDTIKTLSRGEVTATTNKILEGLMKVSAKNRGTYYNMATFIRQTTMNPNVELLYRAPKLRQMQFQWKLTPLNKNDSNQIFKFVRHMKSLMYPVASKENGWLGYPARFVIRIKTTSSQLSGGPWNECILYSMGKASGGMRGPGSIGCVLTDMQVEYGDGGIYGAHIDHAPSSVMINLSFTESTLQTRDSIEEEFK